MTRRGLEELDLLARLPLLTVALDQERLVVEHVALAGRPGHEELDDALGRRLDAAGGLLREGAFAPE